MRKGQITTSVGGGQDDSGNITINNPIFVVLNQGQIKAQADLGKGGNINITSRQFLKTPLSIVDASSKLGINGTVVIRAPNETVSRSLTVPSTDWLEVSTQLPKLCSGLTEEEYDRLSHFFVHPRAVTGPAPHDLSGSPVFFLLPYFQTTTPLPGKVQPSARQNSAPVEGKPLWVMMECQKMEKTDGKQAGRKKKDLKKRRQG